MPELQQNFGTMRRYLPAVLHQNAMGWYIEYYAFNQISQSLERKRVRVNRERKRARTFAEFRSITSQMIIRINCQLASGWSPYAITDTTQVVQVQTLQAQGMQVVQTQGVQVAPITVQTQGMQVAPLTVQTQAVPVTTTIPLPSSSFTQSSTQVQQPKDDGSILVTDMIEKFIKDKQRELTENTSMETAPPSKAPTGRGAPGQYPASETVGASLVIAPHPAPSPQSSPHCALLAGIPIAGGVRGEA